MVGRTFIDKNEMWTFGRAENQTEHLAKVLCLLHAMLKNDTDIVPSGIKNKVLDANLHQFYTVISDLPRYK